MKQKWCERERARAILESRAYREARSRQKAMEILATHQGEWFTTEMTRALIQSDLGLL